MTNHVHRSRTLPYREESLTEVETLLGEIIPEIPLSPERQKMMTRAIVETVHSMIEYSTFKGFDNEFSIDIEVNDSRFRAVITDSLNVFELNEGITGSELEVEKTYEIRTDLLFRSMDEINYTYKRGSQNELELVNFLPSQLSS